MKTGSRRRRETRKFRKQRKIDNENKKNTNMRSKGGRYTGPPEMIW